MSKSKMNYKASRESINISRNYRNDPLSAASSTPTLDKDDGMVGKLCKWLFSKKDGQCQETLPSSNTQHVDLQNDRDDHVAYDDFNNEHPNLVQLPSLQTLQLPKQEHTPGVLSDDALSHKVHEIVHSCDDASDGRIDGLSDDARTRNAHKNIDHDNKRDNKPNREQCNTNSIHLLDGVLNSLSDHSNATASGTNPNPNRNSKKRMRESNECDNQDKKRLKRHHHHRQYRLHKAIRSFPPQPCLHAVIDQGLAIVRDCSLTANPKTASRAHNIMDVTDVDVRAGNEHLNGCHSAHETETETLDNTHSQQSPLSQSTLFKYFRVENPKTAQPYPHVTGAIAHENEHDIDTETECQELSAITDADNAKQSTTLLAYYNRDAIVNSNSKKRSFSNMSNRDMDCEVVAVQTRGEEEEKEAERVETPPRPRKRLRRIEVELTPFVSLRTQASSASPASSSGSSSSSSSVEEDNIGSSTASHLTKVLRARKAKYMQCYKQRLTRIFATHKPENVAKVAAWLQRYGDDVIKLHALYVKSCRKYSLSPLPIFDGQSLASADEYAAEKEETIVCCSREASLLANAQQIGVGGGGGGGENDAPHANVAGLVSVEENPNNSVDADSVASVSTFATPKSEHEAHSFLTQFAPPIRPYNDEQWTIPFPVFNDSAFQHAQDAFRFEEDQHNVFNLIGDNHNHNHNQDNNQNHNESVEASPAHSEPFNFHVPVNFQLPKNFEHEIETKPEQSLQDFFTKSKSSKNKKSSKRRK